MPCSLPCPPDGALGAPKGPKIPLANGAPKGPKSPLGPQRAKKCSQSLSGGCPLGVLGALLGTMLGALRECRRQLTIFMIFESQRSPLGLPMLHGPLRSQGKPTLRLCVGPRCAAVWFVFGFWFGYWLFVRVDCTKQYPNQNPNRTRIRTETLIGSAA